MYLNGMYGVIPAYKARTVTKTLKTDNQKPMMRKKLLFSLLLLFITTITYPLPFDYFGILQKTAPAERVAIARKIYNEQIIHLDSVNAFAALNRLQQWAIDKNDVSLKVFSLIAMGSYQ